MPDPVEAGQQALRAADWRAARTLFGRALEQADRPEARDGLGLALWWLNQVAASHEQRALAYAAFKRDGDLATAARIAAWLAREQIFLHASASGMNGWFARAERLLSELGPCRERGWYLIYRAHSFLLPRRRSVSSIRFSPLRAFSATPIWKRSRSPTPVRPKSRSAASLTV